MGLERYLVAPLVSTSAGMALLKNQSRRRPMLAGSLAGLLAVRSSWYLLHTDAAGKTWTKCDQVGRVPEQQKQLREGGSINQCLECREEGGTRCSQVDYISV